MRIMFDSWSSQVEIQNTTGHRLETLYNAIQSTGASRNPGEPWSYCFSKDPITPEQLHGINVLVILTRWQFDKNIGPSFAPAEIAAIENFVFGGGGLLHISDHGPFITKPEYDWTKYDRVLADIFGVELAPAAFTIPSLPYMTMSGSDLNSESEVITPPAPNEGDKAQAVTSIIAHDCCGVRVFYGSFIPIARVPPNAVDKGTHKPPYSADSFHFAVALQRGNGRVIYAGNSGIAGDYSSPDPAPGLVTYGNNLMFLLNALTWVGKGNFYSPANK